MNTLGGFSAILTSPSYFYSRETAMSEHTVLSSKGQVVIPKALRDAFGWEHGTKLVIDANEVGVTLRKAPSARARRDAIARGVSSLAGMLAHKSGGPPLDDEAVAKIVRERAAARNNIPLATRAAVKAGTKA
jgi:AbrB family looped-hinge helix DNA binding protein